MPDKYKFNMSLLAKKCQKKQFLKVINQMDDPAYCEALIVQLEARTEQLQPDFESYPSRKKGIDK